MSAAQTYTGSFDLAQQARRSLLIHLGIMVGLCAALQIAITLRDNQIDLVAYLGLAAVAGYYAWYTARSQSMLARVRFGRLVAHLVGFLVVNLSYHLHGAALFIAGNSAIRGTSDDFPIDDGWFGVLFGMPCFWGVGLLVHATASITWRGFEELPR